MKSVLALSPILMLVARELARHFPEKISNVTDSSTNG